MVPRAFAVFLAVFLILYSLLQWGIGRHGAAWLNEVFPGAGGPGFWIPFLLIAYAYPVGRIAALRYDTPVVRSLMRIGAYWLAAMFYLVLLLPLADAAVWLLGAAGAAAPAAVVGWIVVAALAMLMGIGSANVWRPVAREHRIRVGKRAQGTPTLRIADRWRRTSY